MRSDNATGGRLEGGPARAGGGRPRQDRQDAGACREHSPSMARAGLARRGRSQGATSRANGRTSGRPWPPRSGGGAAHCVAVSDRRTRLPGSPNRKMREYASLHSKPPICPRLTPFGGARSGLAGRRRCRNPLANVVLQILMNWESFSSPVQEAPGGNPGTPGMKTTPPSMPDDDRQFPGFKPTSHGTWEGTRPGVPRLPPGASCAVRACQAESKTGERATSKGGSRGTPGGEPSRGPCRVGPRSLFALLITDPASEARPRACRWQAARSCRGRPVRRRSATGCPPGRRSSPGGRGRRSRRGR